MFSQCKKNATRQQQNINILLIKQPSTHQSKQFQQKNELNLQHINRYSSSNKTIIKNTLIIKLMLKQFHPHSNTPRCCLFQRPLDGVQTSPACDMLPSLQAHRLPLPPSAPVVSPRPWPPAPLREPNRGATRSPGHPRCRRCWGRQAAGHEEGTAGTLLGHETQAYSHRCPMLFLIFGDNIFVIMLHLEMEKIDQVVWSNQ